MPTDPANYSHSLCRPHPTSAASLPAGRSITLSCWCRYSHGGHLVTGQLYISPFQAPMLSGQGKLGHHSWLISSASSGHSKVQRTDQHGSPQVKALACAFSEGYQQDIAGPELHKERLQGRCGEGSRVLTSVMSMKPLRRARASRAYGVKPGPAAAADELIADQGAPPGAPRWGCCSGCPPGAPAAAADTESSPPLHIT